MKHLRVVAALALGTWLGVGSIWGAESPAGKTPPPAVRPAGGVTFSSLDWPSANEALLPAGTVALVEAELPAVFALYETISGRSVIPGERLPRPRLSYRVDKPLPRRELLQALDTLLAQHGVTMIVMGTNFVRAVFETDATREAAPEVSLPPELLPDSSTLIQYVVRLEHRPVNSAVPVIQPLTRLPNSVITIPGSNSILLRDYSANVRRVLSVLKRFDLPEQGTVFEEPVRRPKKSPAVGEPAK